ncbi:MAG: sigma-54 interaction domain-containing protein, partial [Candidatus Binatia bacterium]
MANPPHHNEQTDAAMRQGTSTDRERAADSSNQTAQLRALETELARDKALKDAIFNASYDGIAVLDADGVFLDINPAFERLTGIKRVEWIGRRIEEMQRFPGVTQRSATLQVIRTKAPATTLVNITGGQMVLITGSPHFGPEGQLRNIILNMRNMTQLNYLKYQLEQGRWETRHGQLEQFRSSYLHPRLQEVGLGDFVFASPVMTNIVSTVLQIAEFDSTILLYGETGTGKGVLAKCLHRLSRRAQGPFVEVNCGALPDTLVESELFGYEPGAFTGSSRSGQRGFFAQAQGGTIFLDEIEDLPLGAQAKLLKVLDDKVIIPLGAATPRPVDVRIVAATNRNLHEQVAAGRFRADLLYRLEVIPIYLPPLRERPEDVRACIDAFFTQFRQQFRRESVLSSEALALLLRYPYPGNVRELRNIMERLVQTTAGTEIGVQDVPEQVRNAALPLSPVESVKALPEREMEDTLPEHIDLVRYVEDIERKLLAHYARSCGSTYELAERTGLHQS